MESNSAAFRAVQTFWRIATTATYPLGIFFIATTHCAPTLPNAWFFLLRSIGTWVLLDACFYYWALTSATALAWGFQTRLVVHTLWAMAVDVTMAGITVCAVCLLFLWSRRDSKNRIFGWTTTTTPGDTKVKPEFKGNKICILGNGPSLVKGEPYGSLIDDMDEVIRFNNFQTAKSGFGDWTGSKTTVHFSDTMLYPSYAEYAVNNACVVLSLFMDRLIISGSYCCFRSCIDLEFSKTYKFFSNPALGWVPHEDIANLKATLGLSHGKHPTSGCLAIDWFVRNRPDPNTPIYIGGFDFFEGDQIHYYDKSEPLYERINDLLGVTMMHQPHKEKGFVLKLVEEGKVKWLKDLAAEKSGENK